MKKARIMYNGEEDKFEIQINTGDGWGLDQAYKCVEGPNGYNDFIHFQFIIKLQELQYQGYEINFKNL